MGCIEQITCRSCGNSWQCETGSGMDSVFLDKTIPLFSEEIQQELKSFQAGGGREFDFSQEVLACGSCQELVAVPVITFNGVTRIGSCPKCGAKLGPVLPLKKMICPRCHQTGCLESQEIGFWD